MNLKKIFQINFILPKITSDLLEKWARGLLDATPIIDFKKIGINVLALLVIRLKPDVWNRYTDDLVSERISKIPYIISAYRVADARASHILLIGFRDTEQKEHYLSQIQTRYTNDIEIKEVYTFSVDKIIIQNPIGLLNEVLDRTDISNYELFPIEKKSLNK